MVAGVDGLDLWLSQNLEDFLDQEWQIAALSEETVDSVDGQDRTSEGMVALAVFTESSHTIDDAAFAMVGSEIDEVYPDAFSEYQRTWDSDPQCFLDRECDRASAYETYTASFPLGLYTTSELQNEYLWVEGTERRAFIQRNWLLGPPETNNALLEVDEMFHLNLFLETDNGFVRLQSAWMVVTQEAVDPNSAVYLVANDYRDNSETLDSWLDENAP